MKGETKLNAIRSGLVVLGDLAFEYLTLEIGFRPIIVKAQEEERQKQLEPLPSDDSPTHESYLFSRSEGLLPPMFYN
ncbi:hypothetical protein LINGRAHAP2_LOCUS32280 [Linum grandiflorum]